MIRIILLAFLFFLAIGCPRNPPGTDMNPSRDMSPDMQCPSHKLCGQDIDCKDTICQGVCIGGECVWNP